MFQKLFVALFVAGMLGFVVANAEATSFPDNFDADTVGSPPLGWNEKYTLPGGDPVDPHPGVTVQVDGSVAVSGQSVHLLDTSDSVGALFTANFANQSSVVVSYDMRTHITGNESVTMEGFTMNLYGDGGSDYTAVFGPNGYIGILGWHRGWINTGLLRYANDTWYHVERTLDCTSNTGTFHVEEIGNPTNSASYSVGSDYVNSYVNAIWMTTSNSRGTDSYLDNVNVATVPEPLTMVAVGMGIAGLGGYIRRRRMAAK